MTLYLKFFFLCLSGKNPRENVCICMWMLQEMQLFTWNTPLHQDLEVCCSWQMGWRTHHLLAVSRKALFYGWDPSSKNRDLWWHNQIQKSFHCFSAKVGQFTSLYVFRHTNSLAYSIMLMYLHVKWQNSLKGKDELYNKMRNRASCS